MWRDCRDRLPKYNTIHNALKSNDELLRVSNMVTNHAIYCNQFVVSDESKSSLFKNGNHVIGTGEGV